MTPVPFCNRPTSHGRIKLTAIADYVHSRARQLASVIDSENTILSAMPIQDSISTDDVEVPVTVLETFYMMPHFLMQGKIEGTGEAPASSTDQEKLSQSGKKPEQGSIREDSQTWLELAIEKVCVVYPPERVVYCTCILSGSQG